MNQPADRAIVELYRTMTDTQLRQLREAFLLDRRDAASLLYDFCEQRLSLIDRVLRERGSLP